MLWLLRILPKNLLSFFFGKLALLRFPGFLQRPFLRRFAKGVGANLAEAEFPIEHYRSLSEFFLRDLKPGLRPIGQGVVSPVDGRIPEHGKIESDRLMQVKGWEYRLSDLLEDQGQVQRFRDGYFITIYLAPKDYHHIHAPVDGEIAECYYIPGTLWPVNEQTVRKIDRLFCVNERVATILSGVNCGSGDNPSCSVGLVAVGATNVGSIALTYDSAVSNSWSRVRDSFCGRKTDIRRTVYVPRPKIEKGERLASFRLGSTVILLFEAENFVPGPRCSSGTVRLGESLGVLK